MYCSWYSNWKHIKFFDNSEANALVAKSAEEAEEFEDNLLGKKNVVSF